MEERAKRPVDVFRERCGGMSGDLKNRVKEQGRVRKLLDEAMRSGPMTVPELAAATKVPSRDVLWHLMAMKKYGGVVEVDLRGDFYAYALAEKE